MPAGTDSDQLFPDIRESCAWINSVDICLSDSLDIPKGTMQEQNPGEVNPNPPREEVADQVPEVYTTHGGVRAFSTATSPRVRSGKRSMQQDDAEHHLSLQQRRDDEVKSTNLHGMVQVDNLGQSFQDEEGAEEIPLTPMLKECIEAIEKDVDQECSTTVETARDNHIILVYRGDCLTPDFLRVSKDHTVGSITVADDRMGIMNQPISIVDAVGGHIRASEVTTPFQPVYLHYSPSFNVRKQAKGMPSKFAGYTGATIPRISVLTWQEGWVAKDEMQFYLQVISHTMEVPVGPIFDCESQDDDFQTWVQQCKQGIEKHEKKLVITTILVDAHWIPVVFKVNHDDSEGGWVVYTTEEGIKFLAGSENTAHLEFSKVLIPTEFPNDCGFQTVNIILRIVTGDINEDIVSCQPFTSKEACCWRSLFAHQLQVTDLGAQLVNPTGVKFGGVKHDDLETKIQELLTQHGVTPEESSNRCSMFGAIVHGQS